MIQVTNVSKSFGSLQVLKNIDIHINEGEIVSIVGPSGAGKTTLLQIIGTLDKPAYGNIVINGVDVAKMKERQLSDFRNKNIGFVFQFHQLLPEFSALENVMIPALIGKSKESKARAHAKELLDMMGLSERFGHKPSELSGGEKQRVAVARALVNSPAVILADEPSGSLDSENKAELHKLFFELQKTMNQTFVIVTHDEQLASITDRTIFMQDGKVLSEKVREIIEFEKFDC
jgi:lipoprotein-releasing system ATP-binding protein